MAEIKSTLSNGDSIIQFDDRRHLDFNIKDLYKYRFVDSSSAVIRGEGEYVPRDDDGVKDWTNGLFRVARVDPTTFVADLVLWTIPRNDNDVDDDDRLTGGGPGKQSESFRVYIDTRVTPHRLDINSRLHAYGEEAKNVIVFNGTNHNKDTGEIISAYYNANGDYQGPEIPLSLTWTADTNNKAEWAPMMGYTMKQLPNGAPVTVVVYNHQGSPIDISTMLVHNTNIVRHPEDELERIQSIELISPYLSDVTPNTLMVPINVTVATLAMRAKVTYTSGRYAILDVVDEDANGKFKLLGLKHWSPTISGTPMELTLTYQPSPESEYGYLHEQTANGTIKEPYRIIGLPVDRARSLKLYAFPTWASDMVGYVLEFWMYDLTRQVSYRVPKSAVELSELSPPFDGLDFISTQHMQFGVRLGELDARYGDERHVQQMQISLLKPGGIRQTNWKVKFSGNQKAWFGDQLEAVVRAGSSGLSTINFANGEELLADWLKRVFYAADPLYDPQTEAWAPEPTHFIIATRSRTFEVPVSQWKNDITFINDLPEGATVYLKWIRRQASGELQLGATGLPIHNA